MLNEQTRSLWSVNDKIKKIKFRVYILSIVVSSLFLIDIYMYSLKLGIKSVLHQETQKASDI